MYCRRCEKLIDDDSAYCKYCGSAVMPKPAQRKSSGNGTGTVIRLAANNYKAIAVIGWKETADKVTGKNKKLPIKKTKSGFKTKTEARRYIQELKKANRKNAPPLTFRQIYEKWEPTQTCGKKTRDGYKYAFEYFKDVWFVPIDDINIDDLQECMDDCPKGKRTKQLMKTVAGLLYKYALPRGYLSMLINVAAHLKVNDDGEINRKPSFNDDQLKLIKKHIGKIKYADYVFCMCYLGFRPSEFIALDAARYNKQERCFVGGAKTEAGINRTVTVSPKIQKYVSDIIGNKTQGPAFCKDGGAAFSYKEFSEAFLSVLETVGIPNPTREVDGKQVHLYTPHCCRRTFATLMKRVKGVSQKDKLALIGHTSEEMLRYYQDVNYSDLRKITDNL